MKTNMTTATLLVVLCCFHVASGVTHKLQYFYTATTGISNFPEFVDVGVVDGVAISRYDSNTQRKVPLHKWMEEHFDQQYWDRGTDLLKGTEQWYKVNIQSVKERFNQTEGVHTLQYMYGCQWDDESGALDASDQRGYDGEDLISLDLKNQRYIASNPQAVITKHKWDNNRALIEGQTAYLTHTCIEWLKKYLKFGSSTLGRTVPPEVTLLQKNSSMVCHSTGFYPDGVMITWNRDGVDMHEDVDMGETLPNEDGTFQKRAELKVSPEERKKGNFTCEVAHKSGKTLVVFVEDGNNLVGIIIIVCVVAALVVIGVGVGLFMMKKKKKEYKKAEQSESGSDTSDPKASS